MGVNWVGSGFLTRVAVATVWWLGTLNAVCFQMILSTGIIETVDID